MDQLLGAFVVGYQTQISDGGDLLRVSLDIMLGDDEASNLPLGTPNMHF